MENQSKPIAVSQNEIYSQSRELKRAVVSYIESSPLEKKKVEGKTGLCATFLFTVV